MIPVSAEYEYKIFTVVAIEFPTLEDEEGYMNELGKDGWEVFRVTTTGPYDYNRKNFYARRPRARAKEPSRLRKVLGNSSYYAKLEDLKESAGIGFYRSAQEPEK